MDEEIKNITKRIAEKFNPRKLILFGSSALGARKENSDVDLCVVKDYIQDRTMDSVAIRKIIGKNLIPFDIVVLGRDEYDSRKNIWGTLQYEIDKKGIVLYERRD
ncbi:nucleotidyltransferase domain-containing protein [Candidatus Saganbacteria bacterium]|nr:nucleotidyltransferase domain-containing protein [Candidatus Saganbacteria bacterium]